jgi:hypothetical protein
MITVFLRFADADAAVAAVRALLLDPGVAAGLEPGEIVSMGYTAAGTRFDLAPVGGDGVLRVAIAVPPDGAVDGDDPPMPRLEVRPGYHLNLLWHGAEGDLPDFGVARIHPETPGQIFAA